MSTRHSSSLTIVAMMLGTIAIACGATRSVTAPQPSGGYLGFDVGLFPGVATLQAWKYPATPYRWIGYYLAAPCHRDSSFVGKLPTITSNGWGVAALYVGQQDWANMAANKAPKPAGEVSDTTPSAVVTPIVCSASLLSSTQGTSEAADAVAKMRADGFPDGSIVYLDVERVTTIAQSLSDYYTAWMTAVLNDGHFKPGVYVAKANAQAFYDVAITSSRGARYAPPFWIAFQGELTAASKPSDVGLPFAQIWQAAFGVTQQFNNASLRIDGNVATKASPSSP